MDRNWALTRLPCDKDWNGKHFVLGTPSRPASADTVGLEAQGLLMQSQVYGNGIKKMSHAVWIMHWLQNPFFFEDFYRKDNTAFIGLTGQL